MHNHLFSPCKKKTSGLQTHKNPATPIHPDPKFSRPSCWQTCCTSQRQRSDTKNYTMWGKCHSGSPKVWALLTAKKSQWLLVMNTKKKPMKQQIAPFSQWQFRRADFFWLSLSVMNVLGHVNNVRRGLKSALYTQLNFHFLHLGILVYQAHSGNVWIEIKCIICSPDNRLHLISGPIQCSQLSSN